MGTPTIEETFLGNRPAMPLITQLEHPREQHTVGPCLALLKVGCSESTRSMDSGEGGASEWPTARNGSLDSFQTIHGGKMVFFFFFSLFSQ